MTTFISDSAEDTERFGERVAAVLKGTEVLALFGGLGMGKTAFVRALAEGLGMDPNEISSPTFAIVHEHEGKNGKMLYHFVQQITGTTSGNR